MNKTRFIVALFLVALLHQPGLCADDKKFLDSMAPSIISWMKIGEFFTALEDSKIAKIRLADKTLNDKYPESITSERLNFCELLETLARQFNATAKYDKSSDTWVLEPPAMPLSYQIKMADGWKESRRELYTSYIPTVQPVGMDVYMMGRFKNRGEKELVEIRNEQALRFADKMKNGVTLAEFKTVKVDNVDAIYFECPAPKADRFWRQWSLIKNNQSFTIVSTYEKKNTEKIRTDVDAMVKSFHVVEPAVEFVGF